jgi:molybdopterin synthase catalytic subunit
MTGRVTLTDQPIAIDPVQAAVARPGAGGIALFVGAVRDEAEGRPVTLLEYEAYHPMAIAEMTRILDEIERANPELRLAVSHRVGALHVGDVAVVCAASAPHRPEAFRACRLLIDEIKARVPIWKREHGPDGAYWVGWRDARCGHEGHDGHGHGRDHGAER